MQTDILTSITHIISSLGNDVDKLPLHQQVDAGRHGLTSPQLPRHLGSELQQLVRAINGLKKKAAPAAIFPTSPDEIDEPLFANPEAPASLPSSSNNGKHIELLPAITPLAEARELWQHAQNNTSQTSLIGQDLGPHALTGKEIIASAEQQDVISSLQQELLKHKKANEAFQEALREIGDIITAVARGDLTMKVRIDTIELDSEITTFKRTINAMMDQLQNFASEVSRVAREVGTEGLLGGQASINGVDGTWRELTDNGAVTIARQLTAILN